MRIDGERGGLLFHAIIRPETVRKSGLCDCCGGKIRRSKYGILHKDCYRCRYLKMIYGPNIKVERQ